MYLAAGYVELTTDDQEATTHYRASASKLYAVPHQKREVLAVLRYAHRGGAEPDCDAHDPGALLQRGGP